MTIWTQRAGISWRQSISFYEKRYDILRQLDEEGVLRRFQERNGRISMRLGDANQLLSFGPTGCSLNILKPALDEQPLRRAIEVVFSVLDPRLVGDLHFGFQALVALDTAYDEARSTAATFLLGPGVPFRPIDFALLLDGSLEEPLGALRLEVGVVEAAEIPSRFARVAGRVGDADADTPPNLWQQNELPSVALFGDIDVHGARPDGNVVEGLFLSLASARDAADELMSWFAEQMKLGES